MCVKDVKLLSVLPMIPVIHWIGTAFSFWRSVDNGQAGPGDHTSSEQRAASSSEQRGASQMEVLRGEVVEGPPHGPIGRRYGRGRSRGACTSAWLRAFPRPDRPGPIWMPKWKKPQGKQRDSFILGSKCSGRPGGRRAEDPEIGMVYFSPRPDPGLRD